MIKIRINDKIIKKKEFLIKLKKMKKSKNL